MTLNDVVTLLTALTPIVTIILVFVPKLWEKAKMQAEAKTESANERKVRAEAAAIQVDTSLDMVTRMESQVKGLADARDAALADKDRVRDEMQARVTYFQDQLQNTQEKLRITEVKLEICQKAQAESDVRLEATRQKLMEMQVQFAECKTRLEAIATRIRSTDVQFKPIDPE